MKKTILSLLVVLAAQFAMAQDAVFKKYENAKGVETVYISKTLLSFAASSKMLADVADMDLRAIAGKIDNIRILSCEKPSMISSIKQSAFAVLKSNVYEELMRVNDDDEKTYIYFRKNGKKNEFVLLNVEKDELELINITGSMTIDDIKRGLK